MTKPTEQNVAAAFKKLFHAMTAPFAAENEVLSHKPVTLAGGKPGVEFTLDFLPCVEGDWQNGSNTAFPTYMLCGMLMSVFNSARIIGIEERFIVPAGDPEQEEHPFPKITVTVPVDASAEKFDGLRKQLAEEVIENRLEAVFNGKTISESPCSVEDQFGITTGEAQNMADKALKKIRAARKDTLQ